MPSKVFNNHFPFTILGTNTNYSLAMRFVVVNAFPEKADIKDNTVYVRIDDVKLLSYCVSQKSSENDLSLSSEGHIYHNKYLSLFERTKKYLESFYRNTRYLGNQEFTDESIMTSGSDVQAIIQSAANSKHKPDMPVSYPFGETHSILSATENDRIKGVSQLIVQSYQNLFNVIDLQFNPDKIRRKNAGMAVPFNLVEGPDNLGYQVGNKIAEGLLKSLAAIAQGQFKLSYKAHSRGACETILVAYELQFVLDNIRKLSGELNEGTVHELIRGIKCEYTQKALQDLMANDIAKQEIMKLFNALSSKKDSVDQVDIEMSLLDPVPGNKPYLLPGEYITWKDERMFTIPKIVSKCFWVGYQNEHSECFAPVLPTPQDPLKTKFYRMMYPGHHGTASGNPYDQNCRMNIADPNGDKTKTVQLIHLLNMIDFDGVERDSVSFGIPDATLYQAINVYTHLSPVGRTKHLLGLYETVLENRAYYDYFNATCYQFLRREGTLDPSRASEWWFGRQYRSIYSIKDKMAKKVKSTDYFEPRSEKLINAQHAALYLADLVGESFDFTSSALDCDFVNSIYQRFNKIDLSRIVDKAKFKEALSILFFTATQSYSENINRRDYCVGQAEKLKQFFVVLCEPSQDNDEMTTLFKDEANKSLAIILTKRIETQSQFAYFDQNTLEFFEKFYCTFASYSAVSAENKAILVNLASFFQTLIEQERIVDGHLTEDLQNKANQEKVQMLKVEMTDVKDSFETIINTLMSEPQCDLDYLGIAKRFELFVVMKLSRTNLESKFNEMRSELSNIVLEDSDKKALQQLVFDVEQLIMKFDILTESMALQTNELQGRLTNEESDFVEYLKVSHMQLDDIQQLISEKVILYQKSIRKKIEQQFPAFNGTNIEDFNFSGSKCLLKAQFIAVSELLQLIVNKDKAPNECIDEFFERLALTNQSLIAYKNPQWSVLYRVLIGFLEVVVYIIPSLSYLVDTVRQEEKERLAMQQEFSFFKKSCEPIGVAVNGESCASNPYSLYGDLEPISECPYSSISSL